ncbi:MAG: glutathione S-transferase N-terminal domain-containing protein [Pseudomonadales bacterium]|nr:glutathione S-transferase N-terminal domain-containing protein [Pseudomonadales bacterium]
MTIPTNVANLSLYHYQSCPYCAVTRKALSQLDIDVVQRDVMQQPKYRSELMTGGGKTQVPCLRIEGEDGKVSWMYESGDIIKYLRRYANEAAKTVVKQIA